MKKLILLLLFLPCVASAQSPMMGAWQSAAASWSPLDLDASDSLLVLFEADRITGKSNLDTVGIIPNASNFAGKWANGLQLTSAQKPLYSDSGGVPFLYFDGVDDNAVFAKGGGADWARPASAYVVWRYYGAGNATYRDVIYGSSLGRNELYITVSNGDISWYTSGDLKPGLPDPSIDSTYLSTLIDSTVSVHYLNARSGSVARVGQTETQFGLTNANFPIRMRVYALYLLNTKLTATKHALMLAYIKQKYGVNLP